MIRIHFLIVFEHTSKWCKFLTLVQSQCHLETQKEYEHVPMLYFSDNSQDRIAVRQNKVGQLVKKKQVRPALVIK